MSQSPYQNPEGMHDNLGGLSAREDAIFDGLAAQFDPETAIEPTLSSETALGEAYPSSLATRENPQGTLALRNEVSLAGIDGDGAFELTDEDLAFLQEAGVESKSFTNELDAEEVARLEAIDRMGQVAAIAYFAEQEARKQIENAVEFDDEGEEDDKDSKVKARKSSRFFGSLALL